ncbi:MAG: hypothetical protein QOF51_3389 [Chloroflexota bacterium]|jgi:capsular polysaccharide biosynthesis protein|nr:hypothetical protein [Chloroflexota bacterium]
MGLGDPLGMLRRRWPIVALVTLLFLLVAAGLALRVPRVYTATIELAVNAGQQAPSSPPAYAYYQDYYSWLSSEYLADDLSLLLKSDAFARDLAGYLQEDLPRGTIADTVRARGTHRVLEVVVQHSDPGRAEQIAKIVPDLIRIQGPKYLAELGPDHGQVTVLAPPIVDRSVTGLKLATDVAVRGAIGLLAGLFLALAVDYLDATLRSPADVERTLGLPVLGEIPATG